MDRDGLTEERARTGRGVLAGRNAAGRRIRYRVEDSQAIKEPGPWFEIIGVVRDLVPDPEAPMSLDNPAKPLVYHA